MKKITLVLFALLISLSCSSEKESNDIRPEIPLPDKHKIGYSLSVNRFTDETLSYAKSVGVDYVEVSGITSFFDSNGYINKTEEQLEQIFTEAKAALDRNGIQAWSVHMAFGEKEDISAVSETQRKQIVDNHLKLLEYIKLLKPKYILFHPSYYIEPNQRNKHISQLIKSLEVINEEVKKIGSTLVVENMLGPELMKGDVERPLMRTVEETQDIFNRLPKDIGLAVDMNHIKNPENLIRAMGDRLETVHVADGTGAAENHYMPNPCSNQGNNDWVEIFKALYDVGYDGVFLYESTKFEDEKEFKECYDKLFQNYVNYLKK